MRSHPCPWCDEAAKSSEALAHHITEHHIGPATKEHLERVRARRQGRTS